MSKPKNQNLALAPGTPSAAAMAIGAQILALQCNPSPHEQNSLKHIKRPPQADCNYPMVQTELFLPQETDLITPFPLSAADPEAPTHGFEAMVSQIQEQQAVDQGKSLRSRRLHIRTQRKRRRELKALAQMVGPKVFANVPLSTGFLQMARELKRLIKGNEETHHELMTEMRAGDKRVEQAMGQKMETIEKSHAQICGRMTQVDRQLQDHQRTNAELQADTKDMVQRTNATEGASQVLRKEFNQLSDYIRWLRGLLQKASLVLISTVLLILYAANWTWQKSSDAAQLLSLEQSSMDTAMLRQFLRQQARLAQINTKIKTNWVETVRWANRVEARLPKKP